MDTPPNPIEIARLLIARHGLRAGAVAQERAEEARLSGSPAQLDRWSAVQAALADLRRSARQGMFPASR